MADEEEKKEGEAAAAPADTKKSKKKLIIGISTGVVLLLLIGVGAYLYLSSSNAVPANAAAKDTHKTSSGFTEEGSDEEEVFAEGEESLGAIFPLETFVVNLSGGGFIRTQLQIEFTTRAVSKRFMVKLVPVRDSLIQLLSSKRRSDLLNREGKEDLKAEIIIITNEMLGRPDIKNVYFTTFVIQ